MSQPTRHLRLPSLCLAAVLSGCYTAHPITLPTGGGPALLAAGQPVRVKLADGSALTLSNAQVIGDSLVGETDEPPRRLAVAVADVRRVEQQELSRGRTAVATGAGVLVVVWTVGLIAVYALFSSL
jgi:hypothetical protein